MKHLVLLVWIVVLLTPAVAVAAPEPRIMRDIVTIAEEKSQVDSRGNRFFEEGKLRVISHQYFDGTWQAVVAWQGQIVASLDRQTLVILNQDKAWQKSLRKAAKG